ncbi:MAG TPA: tripartite tricarboxylate transporter substrate-binding protein [Burkholderiales bacterium]|nr:tripartite tricarboxylate transporter substrate-binding protein [Burkholderiales bacterium]
MKRVIAFALALLAGFAVSPSWSQPYPTRPVRLMIPQPPGGTMDTLARATTHQMQESFGQNIVIDNRSGANGIIAGETLARAAPDGYTLLYTSASLANNQLVIRKPPFDVLKDFAPVTLANTLPGYLIVVNAQSPAKSLKDLVELSKTTRVHFGSSGSGNSQHLLGELINARTGARMVHVPYKGFALIVNAVLGNEIQVVFGSPTTVVAHIKAGRMRAVAYTGAKRMATMPEVPTVSESGIPGMVYEASWHGIFAPAATPRAIILRFQSEVAKAMQAPKLSQYITDSGHAPIGGTPEEFRKFLVRYLKDTAEQLRLAKVEPQ